MRHGPVGRRAADVVPVADSSVVGQTGGPTADCQKCRPNYLSGASRGGDTCQGLARAIVVRRSIGAVTVTALLGAAVAVGAGLTVPGSAAPPVAGAPASVPVRTISPAREDLADPDRRASQRDRRPARHRDQRPPRRRRELPRQRGHHPAGRGDRGRAATAVDRRRRHRVRAAPADRGERRGQRGWPGPGRSRRPDPQRGDAALGLAHLVAAAALPPDAGERGQRARQGGPHAWPCSARCSARCRPTCRSRWW